MRYRPPRSPPSSSYSHSPQKTPDINVNELASRIELSQTNKSHTGQKSSSQLPSYISLLPPEILAEIFTYCIPDERFPIPCQTEAPLLLTHVSAQWRALALSIPDLWTALHINYKDPAEDISATNIWLSRSGNKLLSLSIAIDFAEQAQQEILDALCRPSKRWKHVRFDFRHLFCPPIDISNTNVSPITRLLTSAPKLREVTWVDDLADTDTLLKLPLGRLTRLSLSMDHGTLDYLQVLNQCYNLEHIRITRPFSLTPHAQTPLFLSKLTSLNITCDVTDILDHLVLPALREVRIYGESDKQDRSQTLGHDASYSQSNPHLQTSLPHANPHSLPWNPTSLLSLIDRSDCWITGLSVSPPMTEATLLTCLRRMSASLVKLSVEGIAIGDALLEALTRRSNGRRNITQYDTSNHEIEVGLADFEYDGEVDFLCPNLEEINLDTRVGCTQGVFADMVESRLFAAPSESDVDGHNINDGDVDVDVDDCWISSLRKVRVVDGHKDLDRLKELNSLLRTGNLQTVALRTLGALTVDVIPRKPPTARTRSFFFRRKLCASR
ncbi:hypothetical protein BDZ97DRAFT_1662631 [Flammula alnicola]|nr:hypothetical protein BDZ97DRAFT_1662631 [Flammula alnicola]